MRLSWTQQAGAEWDSDACACGEEHPGGSGQAFFPHAEGRGERSETEQLHSAGIGSPTGAGVGEVEMSTRTSLGRCEAQGPSRVASHPEP